MPNWKAEQAIRDTMLSSPGGLAMIASGFTWRPYRHALLLNKHLFHVANGDIKESIVEWPPQHGKSFLVSQFFTAWHLMQFPQQNVLLGSYETKFARLWGRRARDVMELFGQEFFGVRVDPSSRAAESWKLKIAPGVTPGEMHTAGAGGPLTGRGGTLGVIDDIFKNDKEALSENIRDSKWEWFKATFMSRIREGDSVCLVNTRWHLDDVAGRWRAQCANDPSSNLVILSVPAFAIDPTQLPPEEAAKYQGDPLGRQPGEPLCPKLFSKNNLEKKRRLMGEFWWNSLYQQRPVPLEGGIYKAKWIRTWRAWSELPVPMEFVREGIGHDNWAVVRKYLQVAQLRIEDLPFKQWFESHSFGRWVRTDANNWWDKLIFSVDSAMSKDVKSKKNSWIVMQVWAAKGSNRYLLDQIRFQGAQYAKIAFLCLCLKWPHAQEKYIENKANGPEVIKEFRSIISGIIPVNPEENGGSKEGRAMGITWVWEAGNVWIPHMLVAYWSEDFTTELCQFPLGANDDMVDCQSQALSALAPVIRGFENGKVLGHTPDELDALGTRLARQR